MDNIFEKSVSNDEIIYRDYDKSWDEQLDIKKKFYESQGYKVIFLFATNPIQDRARVVLYDKKTPIPEVMRNYKHQYIKFNGHWCIESTLGICDKCGEYQDHIHYCYYVAVLNWFMCPKCFNEWLKRAKKYREDEAFEKIQYDNTVHRLKTFDLWEE